MAKKIFCDVCGNEMTYGEVPGYLLGKEAVLNVEGSGGCKLKFIVAVKVEPVEVGNGEHVDICGGCRLFLLDRMDRRTLEEMESSRGDAMAANQRETKR